MHLIQITNYQTGKMGYYGRDEFGNPKVTGITQARFYSSHDEAEDAMAVITSSAMHPLKESSGVAGWLMPDKLIHQLSGVTTNQPRKTIQLSIIQLPFNSTGFTETFEVGMRKL